VACRPDIDHTHIDRRTDIPDTDHTHIDRRAVNERSAILYTIGACICNTIHYWCLHLLYYTLLVPASAILYTIGACICYTIHYWCLHLQYYTLLVPASAILYTIGACICYTIHYWCLHLLYTIGACNSGTDIIIDATTP
jgi:hypothetical protein